MQVFRPPASQESDDDFESESQDSDASRLSSKKQPPPRSHPKPKGVPNSGTAAGYDNAAGGGANPRTPQFTPSDVDIDSDSSWSEEKDGTPDSHVSNLSSRTHPDPSRAKPRNLTPSLSRAKGKRGTGSPVSTQKTPVSKSTPKGRAARPNKRGQSFVL